MAKVHACNEDYPLSVKYLNPALYEKIRALVISKVTEELLRVRRTRTTPGTQACYERLEAMPQYKRLTVYDELLGIVPF